MKTLRTITEKPTQIQTISYQNILSIAFKNRNQGKISPILTKMQTEYDKLFTKPDLKKVEILFYVEKIEQEILASDFSSQVLQELFRIIVIQKNNLEIKLKNNTENSPKNFSKNNSEQSETKTNFSQKTKENSLKKFLEIYGENHS